MTRHRSRRKSWTMRALVGSLAAAIHVVLLSAMLAQFRNQNIPQTDPPIFLSLEAGSSHGASAAVSALPSKALTHESISKPSSTPAPPEITLPPTLAPEPVLLPISPVSLNQAPPDLGSSSALGGGEDCAMLEHLQLRLRSDVNALSALHRVPGSARSVANAVQLWDGDWASAASLGGPDVFEPIRDAVVQTVRAAPEGCQTQQVHGPRLIAVPDGAGSIIVSLGSGTWAWKDLTDGKAETESKPPN